MVLALHKMEFLTMPKKARQTKEYQTILDNTSDIYYGDFVVYRRPKIKDLGIQPALSHHYDNPDINIWSVQPKNNRTRHIEGLAHFLNQKCQDDPSLIDRDGEPMIQQSRNQRMAPNARGQLTARVSHYCTLLPSKNDGKQPKAGELSKSDIYLYWTDGLAPTSAKKTEEVY